jgi:hypothetical protein
MASQSAKVCQFAASSVSHGTRTSRKFQTQPVRPDGLRIRRISVAPVDGLKLDCSSPVPPSGSQHNDLGAGVGDADDSVYNLALHVHPLVLKTSPVKNAVTVSRSATVMPTWSKRRACDMGLILQLLVLSIHSEDVADGGLDIGHEDFKTRHISGAEALGNHPSSSRAVAWPRG